MTLPLLAQQPTLAHVDFYGLKKVSREKLMKAAGLVAAKPMPGSRIAIEEKLETVDGVAAARVEAVCCAASGQPMLYIGIQETTQPAMEFLDLPLDSEVELPAGLQDDWEVYMELVRKAIQEGRWRNDVSRGYALAEDIDIREHQLNFRRWSTENREALQRVARNSADSRRRMAAMTMMAWCPNTKEAVEELQRGLRDPDEEVRALATELVLPIAQRARQDPGFETKFSPTWLLQLLHSPVYTDRMGAMKTLLSLTEGSDAALREDIRQQAMWPLLELAEFQYLPHALPAWILAGRAGGLSEAEIQTQWTKETWRATVKKLRASAGKQ
jgi:hypothetical protein